LNFIIWIVAGALLGGAASAFSGSRHRGSDFATSVATGIAAVMAGGLLLGLIIEPSPFHPGEFSLACLLVSLLAAAVPLTVLHEFRAETSAALRSFGFVNRNQSERTKMNERHPAGRALRPLITAGLASILMLFGACASTPPAPESALNAARVAISNAEKAEAGQFAGAELGEAREKLALADNAVRDEDMVMGERFARESQVQAELASARTAAAKAASVNEQLGRGADVLAEEMQRAGEPR
jgi:uncharacterized membrane protein YeaQ/YmgE (transglycosylase-associated protein family)